MPHGLFASVPPCSNNRRGAKMSRYPNRGMCLDVRYSATATLTLELNVGSKVPGKELAIFL